MRIVELVTVHQDLDPWLSLQALSKASGLSVRTLRVYLTDPQHPLPHFRTKEPHVIVTRAGKRRTVSGKITVRWSEFQKWYEAFRYTPDLDRLVDEVVADLRK
jgi:hypothetical protein